MFHGVGKFDPATGIPKETGKTYSDQFGESMVKIAKDNEKVVAITGAMPNGTGLDEFSKLYKKRFFDVGIAEQHGVTLAAGLAISGVIPVIPLYSSFLQRAYDQTLHDVCLQNLHVVFPIDRAGIVGADGETHQGLYDIAYLSHMPNMSILSPCNFKELDEMLDYAVNIHQGPIAIRYPRGGDEADIPDERFIFGKVRFINKGDKLTIITAGRMAIRAMEVYERIKSYYSCDILLLPTIKPLDTDAVIASAKKTGHVITIEDGTINGGIGSMVASVLLENGCCAEFKEFAFPDEPISHGTIKELDEKYHMDADYIANYICKHFIK